MAWQELKKEDLTGLKKYADIVKQFFASDMYYEELSEVYLARQLTNKSGNLHYFLYDNGTKQMVFGIKYSGGYPNPFTQKEGMWRIVDLAYMGDWGDIDEKGVSREALEFGLKSVREWLDKNNISNFYYIFNFGAIDESIKDELKPQRAIFYNFLLDVEKLCWEITNSKVLPNGYHRLYELNRDLSKKPISENIL